MASGLTDQGLVIQRLAEIKASIETALRAALGNGINLMPAEVLGQIVGIYAEREALLWEQLQAVYDSQYPPTAEGLSLDLCVALTGHRRLDATKSWVDVYCTGTVGTIIPQGSLISVDGNPDAKFESTIQDTIGAGVDEVQTIEFSNVPNGGSWTMVFEGETTVSLLHSAVAADVQNALNALIALDGVVVTGDYTTGFVVTFSGVDGSKPQSAIAVGSNTLNLGGVNTAITITETTPGELPHVEIRFQAVEKGAIEARAGTLTTIETVIAGWDTATNATDADVGRDIETDADLRIRRDQTLAIFGSCTVDALYSKIRAIDEVDAARVFTNRENITVGILPPHSVHCVVKDGDEDEIADVIWHNVPAGIEMYGTTHVVVVDSQGFDQDIYFSRPSDVDIYLEVDLEVDTDLFPDNGEDTITDSILAYAGDHFSIGDDVITDWLYCPINCVPGIINITIRIGTAPGPLTDANIPIGDIELALFDSSRIVLTLI